MKQVHIDKIKKANKIVKSLWATCVVLAIIGLFVALLYVTTSIPAWVLTIVIMIIDLAAIIIMIVAKTLRDATDDYEFLHKDEKDDF